jgi:hypothetical protein
MINRGKPHLDQVIDKMLEELRKYFPKKINVLPPRSVSVAGLSERAVGLNNRIGTEARGGFPVVALKGIRLDALVRFEAWATKPDEVDADFTNLESQLMADRDSLRGVGFLRLALENTSTAEYVSSLNAWRRQADYRVLYEYPFQDSDDAESLIARIQIESDQEQAGSAQSETTTVTDQMARWDDKAAPTFIIRGHFTMGSLAALRFVPSAEPGGTVTLTRTFDGATGQPAIQPTLAAFLAAVAGPNPTVRHSQVTFPSLKNFLNNFTSIVDPVILGDWDANNIPDSYTSLFLPIDLAIVLPSVFDRLELTYEHRAFDQIAVLYLRATGG